MAKQARRVKRPIGKVAKRSARPQRTSDGRGVIATPQIEKVLAQWKAFYQDAKIADRNLELARSVVKGAFDEHGVEYFISTLGTIALQTRILKPNTDWEALARAHLAPEVIAKHLDHFTSGGGVQHVLVAPNAWTVEVGC